MKYIYKVGCLCVTLLLSSCLGTPFGAQTSTYPNIYPALAFTESVLVAGAAYDGSFALGYQDGTPAKFLAPMGIALDANYYYISDLRMVRRINRSSGVVDTIAGINGVSGSINGVLGVSTFGSPTDLVLSGSRLFVADWSKHCVREIDISSANFPATTLAGTCGTAGSTDGVGTSAMFRNPSWMALANGSLYISDWGNHTIRKIRLSDKQVTTIAGTVSVPGSSDGIGTSAEFNYPTGVEYVHDATDGDVLFVADQLNNTIRRITLSDNTVTTVAGSGNAGATDDTNGLAAEFNLPVSMASDGQSLYIADMQSHAVRKMSLSDYSVTTIFGIPNATTDGFGPLANTQAHILQGLYFDSYLGLIGTTDSAVYRLK